jgi:hypothetical protein
MMGRPLYGLRFSLLECDTVRKGNEYVVVSLDVSQTGKDGQTFMLHVNRGLGRDTERLLNKAHLPQHVAFG